MKKLKSYVFAVIAIVGGYFIGSGFKSITTSTYKTEKTLLWKISGNGLESPSYLYGTIHVKCPEDIKLSQQVETALNASTQLVLELDMDEPDFLPIMQKHSMNEGMKNVSSELSKEDLEVLNTFFKEHYGADMTQFGVMKPFILNSLILMKSLDCPRSGSYEEVFMAQAKERQWNIGGLEEVADVMAIFNDVPLEEQLAWLTDFLNDEEAFKSSLKRMIEMYDRQDIDGLISIMREYPEYQNLEDALLYNRNEEWIENIESYAKEKATFFAVGAGHLASDRGLIRLLEKEGYTVEPVLQD